MGFTEEEISSSEDFNVYRIYQCCCSKQCYKKEIKRKSYELLCPSCDGKESHNPEDVPIIDCGPLPAEDHHVIK